ncbi:P-loop containing nucleoside triphosphate hydrolase protein [Nemania diffusa]|nr:P-loop containing nucleoside triphosphate hydrolase protein [Nemania diffusa]
MADPLSIAASVAGLIALSGSLYSTIRDFAEQAANPPQSAHGLLLSVSEMRLVLASVSDLIDNFLKYPPMRRALVRLDHLIICLTQSVLSFSELEKFVNLLVARAQPSLWQRWKLNSLDDRITRFTTKIHEHKTSMSLVLNILQCESDTDAHQYHLSLHEMMNRIIDENKELRMRVEQLGSFVMSAAHSTTTVFRHSVASPGPASIARGTVREDDEASTIISNVESSRRHASNRLSHRYSASWSLPISPFFRPPYSLSKLDIDAPFENELAQSWVYTRATRVESRSSFATSQPMSGAWSMLSKLSLGQISNISVIALPITLNDIPNNLWYKGIVHSELSRVNLKRTRLSTDTLRVDMTHSVAVLGECEVGKSTLITTFCFGRTDTVERYTTLGARYYKSIVVDGVESRLVITDTPGLGTSDYSVLVNNAIETAQSFVLVYSMTDLHSFQRIQSLYDIIMRAKQWSDTQRHPIVIVGTKADMEHLPIVSLESRLSLAEKLNCAHFECSVESEDSYTQPFAELVRCKLFGNPVLKSEDHQVRKGLEFHEVVGT